MPAFRFAPPYELPSWPAAPKPAAVHTHDVVIVGGGLAGLTLACDLAQRGVKAVLLDDDNTVGVRGASSRGICYAQKSLEIFERLGIYERIREKGVSWSVGNTFSGDDKVWSFNLQASNVSAQPPFINIQQFYVEWFLVERVLALGGVELRWKHELQSITPHHDHVALTVNTPEGAYQLHARWLIDATGVASPVRKQLGVESHFSTRSADRWCITDVRFKAPLPQERWTWIDAPFNENRAVWQHPMADDVWRLDYQMGEEASAEDMSKPEVASARIAAQLGADIDLEFVWIGPYQYRDLLLDNFRHQRIFFIGDAAHVVSPFGARGGNTGIQDANNLGWKLAWVLKGWAGEELLDSFQDERHAAAAENLAVTRRTSRFLAPRSASEHRFRRAVMTLAKRHAFARTMVNAGRMSVANDYPAAPALPKGGVTVQNVPLQRADGSATTLMQLLREAGNRNLRLQFGGDETSPNAVSTQTLRVAAQPGPGVDVVDATGRLAAHLGVHLGVHLDVQTAAAVTVRPDAYRARA
jgi:3-(3-hydroxy-phenyl)propionate hydroxylase